VLSTSSLSADTGFLDRSVTLGGEVYRYQVYVPLQWNKQQRWPVILFLHGGSGRGRDGMLPTENSGLGDAIRRDRDRFPAIVVFPQLRGTRDRVESGVLIRGSGETWANPTMQEQALAALDASIKEFSGDPGRVYAVGLSLGGQGVLRIASRWPSRFAALVSVCGRVNIAQVGVGPNFDAYAEMDRRTHPFLKAPDPFGALATIIKHHPVWLFHGDADVVVPVDESRNLAAALKAAGADVHYTEYAGVNHNAWDRAFAEPELVRWLLARRREK
jgi:predicted peptidase